MKKTKVKNYVIYALAFFITISPFKIPTAFAVTTQFYSESIFHNEREIYTTATSVNILFPAFKNFKYQISAGNDFALTNQAVLYDYSHFYSGLGLRLEFINLGYLVAENRVRFFVNKQHSIIHKLKKYDQRLLFVINKSLGRKKLNKQFFFNNEYYSETLFSTLDESNLTHFDLIRSGFDFNWTPSVMYSVFLELNIKLNKNAARSGNYFEYKPTLRVKKDWSKTTLAIMLFHFKKNYFLPQRSASEISPNNKESIHLLLTLGGQF